MTTYNELEIESGGQKYIFVTRGRAKPFDEEEAVAYLNARLEALAESSNDSVGEPVLEFPNEPIIPAVNANFDDSEFYSKEMSNPAEVTEGREEFRIPDDKMRRHMFRKDLAMGMKFCVSKYGVSEETLRREAARISEQETRGG